MHHIYHDPLDPTQVYYDPLPENPTEEELEEYHRLSMKMLLHSIGMFLILVILLAIASLFTGCAASQPTVVERVTRDTVRITQLQRDSIVRHDSIYVRERMSGDTVFLEVDRWHTQYRDRWLHDSIYAVRVDSVPVPYPVEKRVPAQLSTWQHLRLWLGNIVLVALAVLAGWWLLKKRAWWVRLFRR